MKNKQFIIAQIMILFLLFGSCRQQDHSSMHHANHISAVSDSATNYQKEYNQIMEVMHHDMASVKPGSDDDINFLKQMIPHHQGAIDMAQAILKSTRDRRVVNMARGIITEQKNEIAIMKNIIQQIDLAKRNKQHEEINKHRICTPTGF